MDLQRLVACGLICSVFSVWGNPSGMQVVSGDASIQPSADGRSLQIQTGSKTILHWDQFSIQAGERVHFQQFDSASSVLNRVIGDSQSALMGELLSNGKLYLINPHGVLIGPGARIEASSFIGSSLDILNDNFLNDVLLFSGNGLGSVVNLGEITCVHGDVALIARVVKNDGKINAIDGHVALATGMEVLLQLDGDQRVFIRPEMTEATEDEGVALESSGSIQAMVVELKSGVNPYAKAIRLSGEINATSITEVGGRVFLDAEGLCEVAAKIDVSSAGKGGQVQILGTDVHILDGTQIFANGPAGGGEVLIGGDYQGANPLIKNAKHVWVGKDTLVQANALENGNGGKVIVWSDEVTAHQGNISIRGGHLGGDGGFAEVSGHSLNYRGFVDGEAPFGVAGSLLLDPIDIQIQTPTATTGSFTGCPATYVLDASEPNLILNTELETQLASCSVTISTVGSTGSQTGSISVLAPIFWTSRNTLTLQAASNIVVSAAISNPNSTTPVFDAVILSANGISAGTNPGIYMNAYIATESGGVYLFGTADTVAGASHGVHLDAGSGIISVIGPVYVAGEVPSGSTGSACGVMFSVANPIASDTQGDVRVSGVSHATGQFSCGVLSNQAWNVTSSPVTFGAAITNPVPLSSGQIVGCQGGSGANSDGLRFEDNFSTIGAVTAINSIIGGTGDNSVGFNQLNPISTFQTGDLTLSASRLQLTMSFW